MAFGDVNGDGKTDIVLSSPAQNTISLYFGYGDGGYAPESILNQASANSPRVVDLDGDGHPDLVVALPGAVGVFYGSTTGIGAVPTLYPTTALVDPVALEVGDLNHDGKKDIVVAGQVSGAAILYQTSSRVFSVQGLLAGRQPGGISLGDLNGDALTDLALCWGDNDAVAVYLQDPTADAGSTASMLAPVTYPTASAPSGSAIVDVNADGKADLAVTARGANVLDVFFQK
jgi:hypothetical protein